VQTALDEFLAGPISGGAKAKASSAEIDTTDEDGAK
jgi:hypothetical protein